MAIVLILAGVILGVVGLDLLTKQIVLANLAEGQTVEWIRGVVHFTFVRNEGAAFGMLADHRWVFMVFSSLAIVGLGVYLFRFCRADRLTKISLAFIIGGGIGNMIDRIAFGSVVDFIELPFLWLPVLNMYFPIFNVADSFVTVGVVILVVCLIRMQVRESRAAKREQETATDGRTDGNGEGRGQDGTDEEEHENENGNLG